MKWLWLLLLTPILHAQVSPPYTPNVSTNALRPTATQTLLAGQSDETMSNLGGITATVTADTTNYQPGRTSATGLQGGWTLANAASGTSETGFAISPAWVPYSAVSCWIYIPSLTNITSVSCVANTTASHLVTATGYTSPQYTGGPVLTTGWNLIRAASALTGPVVQNDALNLVYVALVTTGAANVTVGQVWIDTPSQALIVLRLDGPYCNIFTCVTASAPNNNCGAGSSTCALTVNGFTTLGGMADWPWPIELGPYSANIGTGTGAGLYATWAQLQSYYAARPNTEFYPYAGTSTGNTGFTAAQATADAMIVMKAIKQHGLPLSPFKAMFIGGLGPCASTPQLLQLFLILGPCNTNLGTQQPETFPPAFAANMDALSIQGNITTAAAMQAFFESSTASSVWSTNGFVNFEMHGISSTEVTPAVWNQLVYEVNKCSAIPAGTYGSCRVVLDSQLAQLMGATYQRSPSGSQMIEYTTTSGASAFLAVP